MMGMGAGAGGRVMRKITQNGDRGHGNRLFMVGESCH